MAGGFSDAELMKELQAMGGGSGDMMGDTQLNEIEKMLLAHERKCILHKLRSCLKAVPTWKWMRML